MRFNADGSPDASFGNGGTLVTDLGLPTPKAGGGRYPGASVGIANLAIDSQDRDPDHRWRRDRTGLHAVRQLGGVRHPTHGKRCGRPELRFPSASKRLARVGQIESRPGGYLALASGGPLCTGAEGPKSVMIGIDPNGNVDPGFGSFGFRTLDFVFPPGMAVTPAGKILLMGEPAVARST